MKLKFLIIRFSSIGDIVLTTPLVRCLKRQVPEAEVHYVTKYRYRELLEGNPWIDQLHFLNDHFGELADRLRKERFDYVIDLHHNLRSLRIKCLLKAPARSFRKLNFRKWLRVHLKIDLLPDRHIVDRYFRTVAGFGVVPDDGGLDYFIPEGKGFDFSSLSPPFREGYVAVILSGTYSTKRLPAAKVADICRGVSFPVVLIGGTGEEKVGGEIEAQAGNNLLNLTGRTSIHESADLIRNARVVLTNDTGMMHIAAAFRKKILSFWGNTIPGFGMVPYRAHPASLLLQVEKLGCRPCSKLGYRECPRGHFRCMNSLDMETAIRWVRDNF